MSYQKQHFVPEQYLSAAELNHLEDGIELNRTLARNFEAAHIEALFKNSEVEPEGIVDNDTSGWSDTQSAPSANEHTYLTLRIASNKAWSKPIKISSVSHSGGSASGGDSSGSGAGGDSSDSDIGADLEDQLEEIHTKLEELDDQITDLDTKVDTELDNANKTVQEISDLADDLSKQADEQKEQLEQLAQEMTPLAEWTDGTNTGAAGFVAKADQNSAQLAGIATWQGTTSDSIAALELKATETEASITSLTSWQDEKTETIASIQQTASDQAATISMLTEWKSTVENGEAGDTATAIAAINVKVDGLSSQITELAEYTTEDSKALAAFKAEASNTYATNEMLAKVETDASKSLAEYKQEVTDAYAKSTELNNYISTDELGNKVSEAGFAKMVEVSADFAKKAEFTKFKTETTESISTQIDTATKDFVKSTDIASFVTKDELGKEISKSTAAIEQTVAADYATISSVTAVDNKVTGIQQTVEGNTANIKLVVDNGTVKGNILVDAINNQSSVTINADKIKLNGTVALTSAIEAANDAANSAATKANNAVKSVQYFYLSTTSPTTAPSVNDSGWKATADEWQSGKYLWQKITVTKGDDTVTNSISCLSGATGAAGEPGVNLEVRYINSATTPVISGNNVDSWSTTIPAPEANKATYMTQKLSSEANWSIPVQITGQNGKDGVTPTININANGYWVVNGETTDQKATGEDGETPEITIQDGKWYINGVSTNINATGEAGKDGESIEFVYYRSNSPTPPAFPEGDISDTPPKSGTWTTSPSGITEDYKYEYMSMRVKPSGIDQRWGDYSTPVIWSKWGEKGQDGDGVEYKYLAQGLPIDPHGILGTWEDEPQEVSKSNLFVYVKAIRHKGDGTTEESSPKLWARYSEDGKNGAAAPKVKEVKTQYAFTSSKETEPGDSDWGYDNIPTNWTSSDPVCVWTRDEFTFDNGSVIYSKAVLNQSYSNIANWCDASDRTLINGANIATRSITAAQIAAGSITANEIDASNLKVKAANITDILKASQINGEGLKISSADSASKITLENGKLIIADTKNSTKKGYLNFSNNNVTLFGDSVPLYLNSTNWISLSTLDDIMLSSSTGDIVQEAGGDGGKIILIPDAPTDTTTSSHKLNLEWDSSNSRLVLNPENKLILSSSYNFATEAPIMYLEASNYGQLAGTWKLDAGVLITSAREAKNSIEDVDNRYSVLLDNLKPRRFKYNDGTSDRYHTGLIVDELKDAMNIAEIDSSEFAAYCLDENGGGIRYSELVALLIKEVQDLKKQVAELKSPTE